MTCEHFVLPVGAPVYEVQRWAGNMFLYSRATRARL